MAERRTHHRPAPHLKLTKIESRPALSPDDSASRMAERDRLAAGDARTDAQRWLDDPPSGVAPLATKQPLKSSRPRPHQTSMPQALLAGSSICLPRRLPRRVFDRLSASKKLQKSLAHRHKLNLPVATCPLTGVKRTWCVRCEMSEFDSKRTCDLQSVVGPRVRCNFLFAQHRSCLFYL
jgi:hypothetical protein